MHVRFNLQVQYYRYPFVTRAVGVECGMTGLINLGAFRSAGCDSN